MFLSRLIFCSIYTLHHNIDQYWLQLQIVYGILNKNIVRDIGQQANFLCKFLKFSVWYWELERGDAEQKEITHMVLDKMGIVKCCFTGHRRLPFPQNSYQETRLLALLRNYVIALIEQKKVDYFITGGALRTDTIAAEMVLELKQMYPHISLEIAIPCADQDARWPKADKVRYRRLLKLCDYLIPLQGFYSPGCMDRRNRYMVDQSSYVLAVWTGAAGGTANTVRYALEKGKRILAIDPRDFSVRTNRQKTVC